MVRFVRSLVGAAVIGVLVAAAPVARADAGNDLTGPSGPPEVISCIVNEGCFTYPAPGGGHIAPGPVDPGIGDTGPFNWLNLDLSYLSGLVDALVADLFRF